MKRSDRAFRTGKSPDLDSTNLRGSTDSAPRLQFRADGSFQIVQFTDLHYGESASKDSMSNSVQQTVLRFEAKQTDFVAFSGDMISGYAWDKSEGWYERNYRNVISTIEVMGLTMKMLDYANCKAFIDGKQPSGY